MTLPTSFLSTKDYTRSFYKLEMASEYSEAISNLLPGENVIDVATDWGQHFWIQS
jgi:hypothetical protein